MKRVEHSLQAATAHLLEVVLDPARTWFTGIDHAAKLAVRVNLKTGRHYSPQGVDRQKRGIKKGLPDFLIFVQGQPPLGVEMKVKGGSLSPEQRELRDDWQRIGIRYHVARSLEEVQEILEFCLVPMTRRMNFLGGGYERSERSAPPRHRRPRQTRKSKDHLPLVFSPAAQKE